MPPHLPEALRLGPVRLQVASLDRSAEWYGQVLGLVPLEPARAKEARPLPEAGGPETRLGGSEGVPLVELVEVAGSLPAVPRSRLGLFHFALLLPDRAALGRFLAHLGRLGERVGAGDHGVSEALYLTDPDGLGIEVYADRPQGTWEHGPDGELRMTTDPLDAAGLLRAGGGEPFAGLPPGTRMGHLHLHVGDLAEAEAFYGEALGLRVRMRSYPGALFLAAGGYHHHLGVNTWALGAPPAGEGDARLRHWTVVLPDAGEVEAAFGRLEAGGHRVRPLEAGGCEAEDPWGSRVRILTP